MFGIFKKGYEITAPIDGKVVPLTDVPDPVFAQKLVGDGVAIESTGDIVVSPADGELTMIFRTNHAFGITLQNGVELLVHIGLDTVKLQGSGFKRLAEEKSTVKKGDPIMKIDRKLIEGKGYNLVTPVLITNMDAVKDLSCITGGNVSAGRDVIATYKLK